jgi:hypothetical protein
MISTFAASLQKPGLHCTALHCTQQLQNCSVEIKVSKNHKQALRATPPAFFVLAHALSQQLL